MSKITVLVIEPERKPYVKEIEHTLESLQHEVGGHIQAVYPWEEPAALVCDEESKLKSSPSKYALYRYTIKCKNLQSNIHIKNILGTPAGKDINVLPLA